MNRLKFFAVAFILFEAGRVFGSAAEPEHGLFKYDVTAMIRSGESVAGLEEYSTRRHGYRYLFSSAANRDLFLAEPEKFEVQLGGACGKMGELSGRGNPNRYWLHEKRLFIFASDICRERFQKNPAGHLDRDESAPSATNEEKAKGRALAGRAVEWCGLKKLGDRGLRSWFEGTYQSNGATLPMVLATTVWANGDYLWHDTYNGAGYAEEKKGGASREIDTKGNVEEHSPAWRRALEKKRNRNFVWALLAAEQPDATAIVRASVQGVSEVAVYLDGVANTLWIEESSGKPMAFEIRERGPGGALGRLKRTFKTYETVDGISLPVAWTATFEGALFETDGKDRLRFGRR